MFHFYTPLKFPGSTQIEHCDKMVYGVHLFISNWGLLSSKEHQNVVKHSNYLGIIHLVSTQNFPKKLYFLPPDTLTYVCVSGGKKCKFWVRDASFSESFAYVLNE